MKMLVRLQETSAKSTVKITKSSTLSFWPCKSQVLRATGGRTLPTLSASRRTVATASSANGPSFGLSEEQLEMQAVARKFTKEEIIPKAAELDRTGEYPWEIIKKAWATGLLNGHIPEAVGGLDMSILTGCVIAEELAYGCTGVKTAMEASGLGVSGKTHAIDKVSLI